MMGGVACATAGVSTTLRSKGASPGSSYNYSTTHNSKTACLSAATAMILLMNLQYGDRMAVCDTEVGLRRGAGIT